MKNLYKIKDELYIVSSSEKIKENTQSFKQGLNGDWFYNTIYNFIARTGDITPYDFKIILTTNKLLIKDGVQAIDDEFLEWFVNNPSCEEVEVEREKAIGYAGDRQRTFYGGYKIIIPKEEPKQETLEEAAERYWAKQPYNEDAFMEGAKWQQERSYSEGEVINFLGEREDYLGTHPSMFDYQDAREWFEQFKKK